MKKLFLNVCQKFILSDLLIFVVLAKFFFSGEFRNIFKHIVCKTFNKNSKYACKPQTGKKNNTTLKKNIKFFLHKKFIDPFVGKHHNEVFFNSLSYIFFVHFFNVPYTPAIRLTFSNRVVV